MPKITIYTQVYNAGKYLEQCVSSVLTQTFTDFEYLIVDNASTDGSAEILKRFASQDSRIKLTLSQENRRERFFWHLKENGTGEYFAMLDHDDWLEPTFFERLLTFAGENRLDIAYTGTRMHDMETGNLLYRSINQTVVLDRSQFAAGFPIYHTFFRTNWARLARADIWRMTDPEAMPKISYSRDTLLSFYLLRNSNRIGIDNSILQNYRVHKTSMSHVYQPIAARLEADAVCNQDAYCFLEQFGPVSPRNTLFLQTIYANALLETIKMTEHSTLSPEEKLRDYRLIAEHPMTKTAYASWQLNNEIQDSRDTLFRFTCQAGMQVSAGNPDFNAVLSALSPDCGKAVLAGSLRLFTESHELFQALLRDDRTALADELLTLVEKKMYVKQYDLAGMLRALAPPNSPLLLAGDLPFFRKYGAIARLLFRGETFAALDEMTGILLDTKARHISETFLQIYITLAALENHAPAFLIGKMRLADLCLSSGRHEECRAILDELKEMGVEEDDEDLLEIKKRLEQQPL